MIVMIIIITIIIMMIIIIIIIMIMIIIIKIIIMIIMIIIILVITITIMILKDIKNYKTIPKHIHQSQPSRMTLKKKICLHIREKRKSFVLNEDCSFPLWCRGVAAGGGSAGEASVTPNMEKTTMKLWPTVVTKFSRVCFTCFHLFPPFFVYMCVYMFVYFYLSMLF